MLVKLIPGDSSQLFSSDFIKLMEEELLDKKLMEIEFIKQLNPDCSL